MQNKDIATSCLISCQSMTHIDRCEATETFRRQRDITATVTVDPGRHVVAFSCRHRACPARACVFEGVCVCVCLRCVCVCLVRQPTG